MCHLSWNSVLNVAIIRYDNHSFTVLGWEACWGSDTLVCTVRIKHSSRGLRTTIWISGQIRVHKRSSKLSVTPLEYCVSSHFGWLNLLGWLWCYANCCIICPGLTSALRQSVLPNQMKKDSQTEPQCVVSPSASQFSSCLGSQVKQVCGNKVYFSNKLYFYL